MPFGYGSFFLSKFLAKERHLTFEQAYKRVAEWTKGLKVEKPMSSDIQVLDVETIKDNAD